MKSIFTLFLFFSFTSLSIAQVTVTGTGCTQDICFGTFTNQNIDNTYTLLTQTDGRNIYGVGSTNDLLSISYDPGLNAWVIEDSCEDEILFTNSNPTMPDPPNTGWSTGMNGCAGSPSPTLSGSVLPVELIFFSAKSEVGEVRLAWETASELDNKGFEIERSKNAKEFKQIGFVEGNGTTLEQQSYSFVDENVVNGKTFYYRLRQVDFGGTFEYSDIISIKVSGDKESATYFMPNPTSATTTQMVYTAELNGQAFINVIDMRGKVIRQQTIDLVVGKNRIDLDLNNLTAGIYFIRTVQGNASSIERIIVE